MLLFLWKVVGSLNGTYAAGAANPTFMAEDIAANAPLSIGAMKEELRILADAHPMSPEGFERVQGLRARRHRQRRYRRGTEGVQGEAQAGVSGGVTDEASKGSVELSHAGASAMVKGFGRRPFADGRAGSGAGVRKPPKEETAGR